MPRQVTPRGPALRGARGLALFALLAAAPVAAQELAPPPQSRPPAEGGTGFFAASVGPQLAYLFDRPFIGGSLDVQGGAMVTGRVGLGGQAHVDLGELDLRYLTMGSGRLSFLVLGALNERVTLAAALGGGFIGLTRNTNGALMLSTQVAFDATLGIDLTRSRHDERLGGRLYLPIAVQAMLLPQVRDGLMVSIGASVGIGYRYR